jgi:ParB-like chromosome segregation protein Spo0J
VSKSGSGSVGKLEQVPTSDLIPYARNARTHSDAQVAQIAGSIQEFGFCNPVLIDKANGIIAGHGRVRAADLLKLQTVPCIRLDHLTDAQKRAYILADNRIALSSGWDEAMLANELQDLHADEIDLGLTGFDAGELEKSLGLDTLGDEQNGEVVEDEIPEPPVDPITKPGDLWLLGQHRLLCGDSTKAEDVARLVDGNSAECLFYDPPWDIDVPAASAFSSVLCFGDGGCIGKMMQLFGTPAWVFAWDCVTSWYTKSRPLRRMKMCAWFGTLQSYNFDGAHYGEPAEQKTVTNTRGTYEYVPDSRGKHLSDVFVCPITKLHADGIHSHAKPLDWVRMLIGNCSHSDIYDPFCGSGTTLIAAEQLGRKCYGMEISPQYCDVIVKRWETLTGKTATLEAQHDRNHTAD